MREIDSGITLQKLEIFCCVAELRSVTRAAERIGIAQPVVTAHIRSLEAKLGVRLVGRTGRNISLTEAGQRVFSWAAEVMASKRQLERELGSLRGGTGANVSVAASITAGSYILPDIVIAFHSSHPEAIISTHVSNSPSACEAVRTGECDFGLMTLEGEVSDNLVVETIRNEHLQARNVDTLQHSGCKLILQGGLKEKAQPHIRAHRPLDRFGMAQFQHDILPLHAQIRQTFVFNGATHNRLWTCDER